MKPVAGPHKGSGKRGSRLAKPVVMAGVVTDKGAGMVGAAGAGAGRWLNRHRRAVWFAACALLLVLSGIALVVRPAHTTQLSQAEKVAVLESRQAASATINQRDFTFTQLSQAVTMAYDNKCDEARAVYQDASIRKSGFSADYLQQINQKIEDICSGKEHPVPQTDTE